MSYVFAHLLNCCISKQKNSLHLLANFVANFTNSFAFNSIAFIPLKNYCGMTLHFCFFINYFSPTYVYNFNMIYKFYFLFSLPLNNL